MNSLLTKREFDIAPLTGHVLECSVGQIVKISNIAVQFIELNDENFDADSSAKVLQDLMQRAPEVLGIVNTLCCIIHNGEEIKASDLPFSKFKLIVAELKEVNSDFLSLLMTQVQGLDLVANKNSQKAT